MKWYKLALVMLLTNTVFGQSKKQLKLSAIAGSQFNTSAYQFNTNLSTGINTFALGAGSSIYFRNLFLETEFQFLNGGKSNVENKLTLSGINSSLSIGYNLFPSGKWHLEPAIGLASLNNKIIRDDIKNNQSTYFTKSSTAIVPSLNFSLTNQSGLFYGIKTGYNLSLNKNDAWKNGIDKNPSIFTDPINSIFVQLRLGGVIDLKKKNKAVERKLISNQPPTQHIQMNTNLVANDTDKIFSELYANPDKPTLILLHGGPGYPGDLTQVINMLKERFQIITFHQRGTKKSPCKSKNYTMEAYLSDIEAVRQFYKIDKFHLWGHSWGGLYAQVYAEKYPDNLLSLFLCSPGSGTNEQWKMTEKEVLLFNKSKTSRWKWTQMGTNSLLGMLGSEKAYKRLFKQVMINYNEEFVQKDSLNVNADLDLLKAAPINKTRKEIVKYPLLTGLINPDFKITVTYGEHDIYKASKDFVSNRYPTATFVTITRSGHIPWIHNPAAYNEILSMHYQ